MLTRATPVRGVGELSGAPPGELPELRQELLEIQHQYCNQHGIEFKIVTNRDIPYTVVENVKDLYPFLESRFIPCSPEQIAVIKGLFLDAQAKAPDASFAALAKGIDATMGLEPGLALTVLKHLIARMDIPVDITVRLLPDEPLHFVQRGDAQ